MPCHYRYMNGPPLVLPTLDGALVHLREWRAADVTVVQEASGDSLIPLVTSVPHTSGEPEALAFIRRQHERLASGEGYAFAIADSRGVAVGHIGLFLAGGGCARVGYWVAPSQRRRGYAADALATVTEWASLLPSVDRLELYIEPKNDASLRVAAGAGYQREGPLRAWNHVGDSPRNMYLYVWLTAGAGGGSPEGR